MKPFLDQHFILENATAERLYHEHAADLPIIDYHNHLPPDRVAADHQFANIAEAWLVEDYAAPSAQGWLVVLYVAIFPSCLSQLFFLREIGRAHV